MKKLWLSILSVCLFSVVFAQETTVSTAFLKVKMTERLSLYKGMAEHNAKYRSASSPWSIVVYNITGGVHHGELLVLSNIGKSFTERDQAPKPSDEQMQDLYNKVYSHVESVSDADVMTYKANYSSSPFSERSEKVLNTVYYLKFGAGKEFWDLFARLKQVWEKTDMKVAIYTPVTGAPRVIFSRRLTKGWSELDQKSTYSETYDQLFGKGAYAKDAATFGSHVERTEKMMMTLNKDLSSK